MSLQLTDVSKSFGRLGVLDAVSIDVPRGARLAVVGASGSGKSTLLRIIAGFARPDAGSVRIGDRILDARGTHLAPQRRGVFG